MIDSPIPGAFAFSPIAYPLKLDPLRAKSMWRSS
jgi:hypothetical protein